MHVVSLGSSLNPTHHTGTHHTHQVIPFPLPFSYQVLLGGRDRDFYAHDASVAQAIRAGFEEPNHPHTGASDNLRLDLTLALNAQMSKWQHLLLQASAAASSERGGGGGGGGDPLSPPLVSAGEEQGLEARYPPQARQADPGLDQALQALEAAQRALEEGGVEGGSVDREAVKGMYRRSLALRPTADAHTYLGFLLSYEGAFEVRKAEGWEAGVDRPSPGRIN